ncbi:hypothetical protein ACRYCC_38285 [Actinomadura scrupuli]|uniref:hypothetical protein n=1 Tax=Actinomadura scrupuli TaxID=559629 RepID=UPI003D9929F8
MRLKAFLITLMTTDKIRMSFAACHRGKVISRVASIAAAFTLTGALTLSAVPAEAAVKSEPVCTVTVHKTCTKLSPAQREQITAQLRAKGAPEAAISSLAASGPTFGWDVLGPYVDGWAPYCRIHYFLPWEWILFIPANILPGPYSACWTF